MALSYRTGDLLASSLRVIGHGCNAQGLMGAGIAAAIKRAYPGAFDVYAKAHATRRLRVGEVVPWFGNDRVVLNCITQERYGKDPNVVYVSYEGIRSCMRWIENTAREQRTAGVGPLATAREIGLPKIGAGLARGDWERIAAIIEAEVTSLDVVVYVL
ncbi:macro domain-containing protein [Devosia sp. ZB163]|uniref:macro domain-containing protein n=1 Tax=Devosia sp. ZB163 TaxID=3025938 RepID=UPI0023625846|nr:macro domain-containing protein [Devosia sp. ZB163]MDC9824330.1 macro domain-containing protein [Devosia sp. ZB163]